MPKQPVKQPVPDINKNLKKISLGRWLQKKAFSDMSFHPLLCLPVFWIPLENHHVYLFSMLYPFFYWYNFSINGVFAALLSLLSEFHSSAYRSTVILVNGIIHSAASIFLPLLGWLILTKDIEIVIFDGTIGKLHIF